MPRVSGKNAAHSSSRAEQVRIREAEQARRSTEAAAQAQAQGHQGPPPHQPQPQPPQAPPARARSGAGSREVFAHSSSARPQTRHPVKTPTAKQPARGLATADDRVIVAGAGRLTSAAKRVAGAVSMNEKRAAARAAAATVRDVLNRTKDPLAKGAILERSHDALRTIGAGLDTLSGAGARHAGQWRAAARGPGQRCRSEGQTRHHSRLPPERSRPHRRCRRVSRSCVGDVGDGVNSGVLT
jgi:hypothetical protein